MTVGSVVAIIIAIAVGVWVGAESDAGSTELQGDGSALSETILALPAVSGWRDGYERDLFGDGWLDTDRNGCDTRNDILARDLEGERFKPGTQDCVVLEGVLHDPYTDTVIDFVRGNDTSELVQIDHVVALSWAWGHGAADWSEEKRKAFANDPLNLLAVDGATNAAKSDSGPAEWVPPVAGYHCAYAERFTAVLDDYDLAIGNTDRQALLALAEEC